jgi:hypoxanthine phosphoribosyltransferase
MTTTPQCNTTKERSPAVLIVDDDDDIRETLRACLEQLRRDKARAAIPVAVMSGSHRGEVGSATYVVPKPFDLGAMVDLVREHCADAPAPEWS